MEATQRATVHGPTFIRLLARLGEADVPPPRQSLSDRLSHWLDWKHAVALATALDAAPDTAATPVTADAAECARVRAALAQAIAGDAAFAVPGPGDAADFAFFRQRCLTMQQVMEADIAHLRGRLRGALAATTGDAAQLAPIDAVMERTLGRHERTLLASVPALLGAHFERLRRDAQTDTSDAGDASVAWLDTFRNDMQAVLLAELDVRLQPAEALLAALRPR